MKVGGGFGRLGFIVWAFHGFSLKRAKKIDTQLVQLIQINDSDRVTQILGIAEMAYH